MKGRIAVVIILAVLLTGCSSEEKGMDRVLQLRQNLQECTGCSFAVEITADYGDELYTFEVQCSMDEQGNLAFTISEPETIAGITGTITDTGGNLTFDDQMLAFPVLTDGLITPVSAPWVLLRTLRGGYLRACSESEAGLMVIIDDSYQDDSLQLDIWLDEEDLPKEAEILWQGRRVVSMTVKDFVYR